MSKPTEMPNVGALSLNPEEEEQDTEDLFASPSTEGQRTQKQTPQSTASSAQKEGRARATSRQDAIAEREARLRAELEQIRAINRTIEGVTASLTKAKENMATVDRTVSNASNLLTTWTRILSQTEHNQRLILNPNWQGATQDLEDAENDELRAQQEAERKAMEAQRQREEAARRAEEEERRRAVASTARPASGIGRRGSVKNVRGTRASQMRAGFAAAAAQGGRGRGTVGGATSSTGTGSSRGAGRGSSVGSRGRGRGIG